MGRGIIVVFARYLTQFLSKFEIRSQYDRRHGQQSYNVSFSWFQTGNKSCNFFKSERESVTDCMPSIFCFLSRMNCLYLRVVLACVSSKLLMGGVWINIFTPSFSLIICCRCIELVMNFCRLDPPLLNTSLESWYTVDLG